MIDQRNGRVYRGRNQPRAGRESSTRGCGQFIRSSQILLKDTYDQRIKFIEIEKRRLKDFYLGDAGLDRILEKILREGQDEKKGLLKKLSEFRIDLAPRRDRLLKPLRDRV